MSVVEDITSSSKSQKNDKIYLNDYDIIVDSGDDIDATPLVDVGWTSFGKFAQIPVNIHQNQIG